MSYRDLKSYQQAAIVYDFTVDFCDRYVEDRTNRTNKTDRTDKTDKFHRPYRYYSRMSDQMIQAARSGKQNIVEGSSESTSEKSELKLLGVARASFQELLEDYEDFLRQRGLRLWRQDDESAKEVRALVYKSYMSYKTYRQFLENPEIAANAMICLINQTNFLLDRQIKAAEESFMKTGGYTENLRRTREDFKKSKLKNVFNQYNP
ncbi:four helix bundle protein [bacterium]|nr:MAG: four helix bundle protein [bacterium]